MTILFLILFLIAILFFAWSSYVIVPEQYEYALEFFGKRQRMLKPGLHLICLIKLGWFYNISKSVYTEVWQIPLFKSGEASSSRYEIDLVEFADMSAKVDMNMLVKCSNSTAAAYNSQDPGYLMLKLIEAAVSNLLSSINATEAITLKGEISLAALAYALEPDDSSIKKDTSFDWSDSSKTLWKTRLFFNFTLWGYKLLNVTLSDVLLPAEVVAARKEVAMSEINKTVAEKQQKVEVIKAETAFKVKGRASYASWYEIEVLSRAKAQEVQALIKNNPGMTVAQALDFIVQKEKWTAIKEGNSQVIISDGSTVSDGAKFGAGFHASKKS